MFCRSQGIWKKRLLNSLQVCSLHKFWPIESLIPRIKQVITWVAIQLLQWRIISSELIIYQLLICVKKETCFVLLMEPDHNTNMDYKCDVLDECIIFSKILTWNATLHWYTCLTLCRRERCRPRWHRCQNGRCETQDHNSVRQRRWDHVAWYWVPDMTLTFNFRDKKV